MAFHCTSCNGSMVFDVASQQMKCLHCGNMCDPQDFAVRDAGIVTCVGCGTTIRLDNSAKKFCPRCGTRLDAGGARAESQEMARFTCQNCGAELEGTEDSLVGFCPYCGGQSMIKGQGGTQVVEDIIPFQVDKERCVELYETYTRGVRFLPPEFRDPAYIRKFTGIYMPFYQYDVRFGQARLTGQKTVVSNSRYDEIEHYAFPVTAQGDYLRGVTFDASRYLDDEISERTQPFGRDRMRPYNPAYLAGFYADASTVDAELYHDDVREQATRDLVDSTNVQMTNGYGISVDSDPEIVEVQEGAHHPVLLPLWFLTWRKDERVAYAVINGETGKVVSDLPLNLRSFALCSVVVSLVLFALLELLFQPTPLITSLISLVAALLMGGGISSGARQEFEKQQHANDKGWGGTSEQATKTKKRKGASSLSSLLADIGIAAIIILVAFMEFGIGGRTLQIIRLGLPVLVLAYAIYVLVRVLRWHKHIRSRDALLAAVALIVTVILNAIIVIVSPVNDGWYYLGDAVCIVGLVLTSVAMIRLFNLGTTRPLPKLFDRTEVSA